MAPALLHFTLLGAIAWLVVFFSLPAYLALCKHRREQMIQKTVERLRQAGAGDLTCEGLDAGWREYLVPWLLALTLILGALVTTTGAGGMLAGPATTSPPAADLPPAAAATAADGAGSAAAAASAAAERMRGEAATPARPTSMSIAFLGAALFIVQMIYRRLVACDLKPVVYFFASMRIFVALGVAYIGDLAMGLGSTPQAYLFGFVAGLMPESALLILRNLSRKAFRFTQPAEADPLPLTMLQGCNSYQQARLLEDGIEDAQNLANCDLTRLAISTPFDLKLLMDWVDQAVLYAHAPDATLRALRRVGIRSTYELATVFEDLGEMAAQKIAEASRRNARGLSTLGADQVALLYYSTRSDPNGMLVCRYWRDELAGGQTPARGEGDLAARHASLAGLAA